MKKIILAAVLTLGFAQAEWIDNLYTTPFEQEEIIRSFKHGNVLKSDGLTGDIVLVVYACNTENKTSTFSFIAGEGGVPPKSLDVIIDKKPVDLGLVNFGVGGFVLNKEAKEVAKKVNGSKDIRVRSVSYSGRTAVWQFNATGITETKAYKACN